MMDTIFYIMAITAGICVVVCLIAISVDNVSKEWQREEQMKYDALVKQKNKKEDTE